MAVQLIDIVSESIAMTLAANLIKPALKELFAIRGMRRVTINTAIPVGASQMITHSQGLVPDFRMAFETFFGPDPSPLEIMTILATGLERLMEKFLDQTLAAAAMGIMTSQTRGRLGREVFVGIGKSSFMT